MNKALRVLVTGTRKVNINQSTHVENVLHKELDPYVSCGWDVTIVHGACSTGGVDRVARRWSVQNNCHHEPHPADWPTKGKKAGPIRNAEMVELGANFCLAFPDEKSDGTFGCAMMAMRAGIPTRVYPLWTPKK